MTIPTTLPRHLRAALCTLGVLQLAGCAGLEDVANRMRGGSEPTTPEIVDGLKEALTHGIAEAVAKLSQPGGYLNDAALKIGFPAEAEFVASTLRKVGLGSLVDQFEQRLNRGAEEGAKQAVGIFKDAISQMTFADATAILLGEQHAATEYFRQRTSGALAEAFAPRIRGALDQVGATAVWSELTTAYNRIPLTSKKVDTDIVHYATERALDGLFVQLATEEQRIRADPAARATALLQKVFSYAASQMR